VTFAKVQAALAAEGMRITPPLAPRAGKSVVASLLERQPTLIPRYNYHLPEPLRDCGVVWGSGDVMYTGEAGTGPLSLERQWRAGNVQIEPKGPAQTDFFRLLTGAQGTMGIVTWASVKCELLATAHKLCFVPAASLEQLIDLVYGVNRVRLGDEVLLVDAAYLARLLTANGATAVAPAALVAELPAWTLIVGLGGREHYAAERVAVAEKDLRALAGLAGLEVREALAGVSTEAVGAALFSCLSGSWKLAAAGASADIFFLCTLDKAAGHVATARAAAEASGLAAADLGVYIQPQHQGVSQHVELSLPYDPNDPTQTARAKRFFDAASARLIAEGAYFSRPYGSWAQPVYARDPASAAALRKVKKIFDPNSVMNPGKLCFGVPDRKEA
jgi:FAD/FMN-containing dehydrogenase